jgi:hypothetical protein
VTEKSGSEERKSKRHQPNEESTSPTSSLFSKSHGKCLMAKDKKKKRSKRCESKFEEEEDDLDLDNLSKKDIVKIKKLFKRIQEQELQLEEQEEYFIGKIEELKTLNEEHEKLKHSLTSLIGKHENLEKEYACATNVSTCVALLEKENANLKAQLEVLTSKHVKV